MAKAGKLTAERHADVAGADDGNSVREYCKW
jgi:hypothetical protein